MEVSLLRLRHPMLELVEESSQDEHSFRARNPRSKVIRWFVSNDLQRFLTPGALAETTRCGRRRHC